MQEEVENRTINLAISTTKLTARTIVAGIRKHLQSREKAKVRKLAAKSKQPRGKQTVKELLGHLVFVRANSNRKRLQNRRLKNRSRRKNLL